jgi:Ca2+-dependent lipid-binding protein
MTEKTKNPKRDKNSNSTGTTRKTKTSGTPPKPSGSKRSQRAKDQTGVKSAKDKDTKKTKIGEKTKKEKIAKTETVAESEEEGDQEKPIQLDLESGQKIIRDYIHHQVWILYVDMFLLFSISIVFGYILHSLEPSLGVVFLAFAIVCCSWISVSHYQDIRHDQDIAMKDLEEMLK